MTLEDYYKLSELKSAQSNLLAEFSSASFNGCIDACEYHAQYAFTLNSNKGFGDKLQILKENNFDSNLNTAVSCIQFEINAMSGTLC
jgi:hypothetical protein